MIAPIKSSQSSFDYSDRWRVNVCKPSQAGEITVDLFCGGGGASVGIEAALNRSVDVAINHSEDAIFYHEKNHPATEHYKTDVFDVHPQAVSKGRPVGLLWLSPDCTHFSKARGRKPKSKNIRSLATVGLWWAAEVKPRIIILENVSEFQTWGRLDKRTGEPDLRYKSEYFYKFVRRLEQHDYTVEYGVRRACDSGAPTIRERFFLIARCDGDPITWPKPTHGPKTNKPYRTASEYIDFSLPTVSIFATQEECKKAGINARRPLAANTIKRIAKGVWKFVLNAQEPFIIPIDNKTSAGKPWSTKEPLNTIVGENRFALCQAFLELMHGTAKGVSIDTPLPGISAQGNHHALVCCHIEQQNGCSTGCALNKPLTGITADVNKHALVTSHLMKYHGSKNGESRCHDVRLPLPTIDGSNRFAEVRAFLVKYYGQSYAQALNAPLDTITGNDRFGLVTVHGSLYRIVDIGMRMLTPDELLGCQFGRFAKHYRIDGLGKSKAVKMIGNSVCPDESYALVKANYKPRSSRFTTAKRLPKPSQYFGGMA